MKSASRFTFRLPFLVRCLLVFSVFTVGAAFIVAGCSGGSSSGTTTAASNNNNTTTTTTTTSNWTGGGDGIWRRDANTIYGEAFTFDPCKAHQPGGGEYHYHQNPVCLRYQVGDNITGSNVGTSTATYTEASSNLKHSPILGWSYDGYPVYGPYGYSDPKSASSGIRRMVSGFSLRTDNTTTRTTLPAWAASFQGVSATLTSTQYGPAVSSTYPLGRYIEDYQYIAPGTTGGGDLDQYNGRFCVTPDFPGGTYAYFVAIDSTGKAAFPYYLSAQYYGNVTGGKVTAVTETTSTYATQNVVSGSSALPNVISWFIKNAATYAQIINETNVSAGPVTTWTGNTTPSYADIQKVYSSTGYVYVNTGGLASHIMGPWYLNQAQTQPFPNYPANQNAISRFPLTQVVATMNTSTGGGAQGRWVNGVAMFNMYDFYSWSNSAQADVGQ